MDEIFVYPLQATYFTKEKLHSMAYHDPDFLFVIGDLFAIEHSDLANIFWIERNHLLKLVLFTSL